MSRRSQSGQDHVLYMGLMMKRGGIRKNWTLRWFEITKTHLIYFKFAKGARDTDYNAQVKGVIKLSECLNVYLHCPTQRNRIMFNAKHFRALQPRAS